MEDVGGWRVVDDDDLVEVSAQTAQVFYVVPFVEDAGLPEETAPEGPPFVQQVGHGICILRRNRGWMEFNCFTSIR